MYFHPVGCINVPWGKCARGRSKCSLPPLFSNSHKINLPSPISLLATAATTNRDAENDQQCCGHRGTRCRCRPRARHPTTASQRPIRPPKYVQRDLICHVQKINLNLIYFCSHTQKTRKKSPTMLRAPRNTLPLSPPRAPSHNSLLRSVRAPCHSLTAIRPPAQVRMPHVIKFATCKTLM